VLALNSDELNIDPSVLITSSRELMSNEWGTVLDPRGHIVDRRQATPYPIKFTLQLQQSPHLPFQGDELSFLQRHYLASGSRVRVILRLYSLLCGAVEPNLLVRVVPGSRNLSPFFS
jgi:hypothetical protein